MRDGERFIWVSALGNPKQQPAHVRTIIRRHVMKDIGKSRRKSERRDVLTNSGKSAAVSQDANRFTEVTVREKAVVHQDMVLRLCRSLSDDNTREPLVYRMPAYLDAMPIRRRIHGRFWQDLFDLDHSASYQIDLMLIAYFDRLEGGGGYHIFDLDGPPVMTLRVKALQETQKAIEDPDRCVGLGVIVAVIASIFEAYVRGDMATCKLHLFGLRAVIAQRQRQLGAASLYNNFKICLLITSCEITCARGCGISPQFPFPLSYFQASSNPSPPRCPSKFSQLVNKAWTLDPGRYKSSKVIYDSIISHPEPQRDEQPICRTSASATLFSMLYGFKQWLVCHDPYSASEPSNTFVEVVASSMNEILPDNAPDAPAATLPTTQLLDCPGQDILKLMILVTGAGT
ncbi:hypothetical protein QM012_005438 [Aureobasidium pullulans]|uniref:Uncharacterized protein n=1 Tax=Aureobasidium pullulans TaxID=5580 RepID=A0ABR0T5P4_AURPU